MPVEPRTVTPPRGIAGNSYSGWLGFAGTLIIVIGGFNIIQGLVALFEDEYFVVTKENILLFDFTAWGWILLVVGALQLLVGFSVLANKSWARVAGILMAIFVAVMQLGFLAAFPIWSVLIIALCVLVIYALIVPASDLFGDEI